MTYKINPSTGQIFDPQDGQIIATMHESATPEQGALLAISPILLQLCQRALLALYEDEFPQLRQDLREAIGKATP